MGCGCMFCFLCFATSLPSMTCGSYSPPSYTPIWLPVVLDGSGRSPNSFFCKLFLALFHPLTTFRNGSLGGRVKPSLFNNGPTISYRSVNAVGPTRGGGGSTSYSRNILMQARRAPGRHRMEANGCCVSNGKDGGGTTTKVSCRWFSGCFRLGGIGATSQCP